MTEHDDERAYYERLLHEAITSRDILIEKLQAKIRRLEKELADAKDDDEKEN